MTSILSKIHPQSYRDMVALVTGSARGLGLGLVDHLLKQESRVVSCDVKDSPLKDEANLLIAKADVTSEADMVNLMDDIKRRFGRLDLIVNGAATFSTTSFYGTSAMRVPDLNLFVKHLTNNCIGTFNVCRLAAPLMAEKALPFDGREENGVIINVGSIFAEDGNLDQVNYASSKAAVTAMTLPLSRDLASLGIRVVTVSPGLFVSEGLLNEEHIKKQKASSRFSGILRFCIQNQLTLNRLGDVQDFVKAVEYVLHNPMLNGCNIRLDDGTHMVIQ